ncbi:peptide-methionine (S)-S-oxide reductase MsrA [Wenyingzhuangia marina]|uniref:Peptide methionine sulfoxide reductase MsrA n=1 Tax=Wenyingzhuangia marina TaxID=1195760 RepID=A0A1M5UD93_9FLAO|nr:peptide-methionine (S)-S-oxide reductase MsrA [Wenyingzhuangia marina]GGF68369.1 peptide methionine sulfoxide reductase MsrA 1 [Wenyingzhuangia marina]SHH60891.1 peptide-methionine (S)-S-oxide reductase [Wenyingzhuangia marina]
MRILLLTLLISSSLFSQTTKLPTDKNLKVAYFASGCFWCVEAIYESVPGVKEAISGYAGSDVKNPTYKTIHKTGHAETVAVYYNPLEIDYAELINVYYLSQDPTTVGQNPDFGNSYRSIIFYSNEHERKIAQAKFNYVNKLFNGKAVTEIKMIDHFYPAEDYHQNYEKNHPDNSYVKAVSIPRLNRFKDKYFKK